MTGPKLLIGMATVLMPLMAFGAARPPTHGPEARASGAGFDLVRRGASSAVIVTADDASHEEQYAALELQAYLRKISGATLPIVTENAECDPPRIWIGRAGPARDACERLRQKDQEAFLVRTSGGDLILAGGGGRGVIYAVYDFLEQDLGCRWLGPGDLWEEIPPQATITLPAIDRLETPGMQYRMLREASAAGASLDDPENPWRAWRVSALSWAVKQRLNVSSLWPGVEIQESQRQRTVDIPGGHRGWLSPHTVHKLLPPEEFFETHPKWYGMHCGVWGLRPGKIHAGRKYNYWQLCTTNPEVIEAMAGKISAMFKERPELDFISLGPGDGLATTACECPACQALDAGRIWQNDLPNYTHRWLTFVNDIAARLAETDPGKQLVTIAYNATQTPPQPGEAVPATNVMVQLADWVNIGCRLHSFDNAKCVRHEILRRDLDHWRAVTPAGMLVYLYLPIGAMQEMPYPMPLRFADDMKYLHRHGAIGAEAQTIPEQWGTYGITKYVLAKAMWNPELNAAALVNDYCVHAFHEAAEPMGRFFTLVETAVKNVAVCNDKDIFAAFTPELFDAARQTLTAAQKLAANPVVKKRIYPMAVEMRCAELLTSAWTAGQAGMDENNPDKLREGIAAANGILKYLAVENKKMPLYISRHTRLRLMIKRWEDALQTVEAQSAIRRQAQGDAELQSADILLGPELFTGVTPRVYRTRCAPRLALILYAAESVETGFGLERRPPAGDWQLIVSGQDNDRGEPCPIRITLNGQEIFKGANPCKRGGWSQHALTVPASALAEQNNLRLDNLAPPNPDAPPWFAFNYAIMRCLVK